MARPAAAQNVAGDLWDAQARVALDKSIVYGSLPERGVGLSLVLGQPQNTESLVLLNPGRAGTISNRAGLLSLETAGSRPRSARADTITNDTFTNGAGTGVWSNAGNWSAGLPGSNDNVLITGTGSASSVTQDTTATINNLTLNSGNS